MSQIHADFLRPLEVVMTSERLIKSKSRVQKHGEVFTPSWMVQKMLKTEGIKEACENIETTFLEPAAGEGNFLIAILSKKLDMVAEKYSKSLVQYENFSLYALSTLYGIELLEDNAQICTMNLFDVYKDMYAQVADKFDQSIRKNVKDSAMTIISANIAQGNFLTRKTASGTSIVFSEWKMTNKLTKATKNIKVQRTEYSLDDIFSCNENKAGSQKRSIRRLDLFSEFDDSDNLKLNYIECKIVDAYKEEAEFDE